jgi:hypothetical protein
VGRTTIAVPHEGELGTLLAKWRVAAGWQGSFRTWVGSVQGQVAIEPFEDRVETPNGAAGERPASVEADALAKSIVAERRAYRMLVDGWRSQLVWLVLLLGRLLRLLELLLRGLLLILLRWRVVVSRRRCILRRPRLYRHSLNLSGSGPDFMIDLSILRAIRRSLDWCFMISSIPSSTWFAQSHLLVGLLRWWARQWRASRSRVGRLDRCSLGN